jgi:hypothetical protein
MLQQVQTWMLHNPIEAATAIAIAFLLYWLLLAAWTIMQPTRYT